MTLAKVNEGVWCGEVNLNVPCGKGVLSTSKCQGTIYVVILFITSELKLLCNSQYNCTPRGYSILLVLVHCSLFCQNHWLTSEKGVHQLRYFLLKNNYCCLPLRHQLLNLWEALASVSASNIGTLPRLRLRELRLCTHVWDIWYDIQWCDVSHWSL